MDLKTIIQSVAKGQELSEAECAEASSALADANVSAGEKEGFLEALSRRGETPGEIAGFARAFRQMARGAGLERWAPDAIDVCGTGGDHSGSFNISTTVAFALAAAGVPVFKHGNRSITSRCGSADVIEGLGLRIEADEAARQRAMGTLNFVFLFAPAFHPAFKEIGPVRRALAQRGVRTVFNLLGPLLNPAAPAHQIVGVFHDSVVVPVAHALHSIGLEAGLVVNSRDSAGSRYDELTTVGVNRMVGCGRQSGKEDEFECAAVGLEPAPPSDLKGGDLAANLAILDRVLEGTAPRGLIETIMLNIAAGLLAVGRVESLSAGLQPAEALLLGGATKAWLAKAREFHRG